MKCLNRLEIQQYLDDEVSSEEKDVFLNHMQSCGRCRSLWNKTKTEIEQLKHLISSFRIQDA